jgi:Flp pilus assembly pilin Flp
MDLAAKLLTSFVDADGAATAIEYAFIASLLSIAILTVVGLVGADLVSVFGQIETSL